nr:THO complex subunit 6 homolog [Lytechinus pictus]
MALSYEEQILKEKKQLHMSVFAQCISPDGKYLLAGNNYGTIAVFSMRCALSSDANENSRKPIFTFKAFDGAIFALQSTENFLICGGSGDIKAWKWKDIQQKAPRVAWSLSVPHSANFGAVETNGLAYNRQDNTLYSGGGDSELHVWDLESGTCKHSYTDHTDYIHAVALFNTSAQVASGSEDGTVRIWDTRTSGEPVAILEPNKHEECINNPKDKWISCVAVDPADDWLICGGGPSLSLWHLRSLSPTTIFEAPKCQPHVVLYHDDAVISAGTSPNIYHWHVNGDSKLTTPCTAMDVYSVVINTESEANKVMCASGASSKIDVYTNFGYKAFSLDFC